MRSDFQDILYKPRIFETIFPRAAEEATMPSGNARVSRLSHFHDTQMSKNYCG